MAMTTMSDLPRDLVEEIVARVPLKHMRAVRLTCKKWNALFKSRSFTKMNIGNEEAAGREYRVMVMMDYSIQVMSIVVNDDSSSTKSLGKLTFLNDSEKVKFFQFFHCEGLLLLCIFEKEKIWKADNTKIVVWNPYLGQTRWIKTSNDFCSRKIYPLCISPKIFGMYNYALGYENTSGNRRLKILRFIDDFYLDNKNPSFEYEMYDFESDLWTSLDVCPEWHIFSKHGASLKGNTYWGVLEWKRCSPIRHIICFDFTSERFGPLLPLPFIDFPEFASLRQEKLVALFKTRNDCYIEIWITTEVEPTQVSWSHFYTMSIPSCFDNRFFYKLRFFVDEEKKVVVLFDRQGTTVCDLAHNTLHFIASFTQLLLQEEDDGQPEWQLVFWPLVCSYIPSLMQIRRQSD